MPFSDALVSPIRLSQNVTKCHTPVSFCTKPKTLCQSVMPQYDCHAPYNSILIQFLWGQMHKVKTHHLVQISDFFQIQTVLFCWASKQFILLIIFVHSWNNFPQIAGIEPFLHSQYHNFLSIFWSSQFEKDILLQTLERKVHRALKYWCVFAKALRTLSDDISFPHLFITQYLPQLFLISLPQYKSRWSSSNICQVGILPGLVPASRWLCQPSWSIPPSSIHRSPRTPTHNIHFVDHIGSKLGKQFLSKCF